MIASEEFETQSYQRNASITNLVLEMLEPNPWQPRQHINQADLIKLAENIRVNGLIHAVTVRRNPNWEVGKGGAAFQIAAGERRWRAYQLLANGYEIEAPAVADAEGDLVPGETTGQENSPVGIKVKQRPSADFIRIQVIIRDLDDAAMMRIAIGENEQRIDVTAMEEAEAFAKMVNHLGITQTDFGKRMGLSQSLVANRMRLLKLPEAIRWYWVTGDLKQWHGLKLLEWQNKFNLTLPYMKLLAAAFYSERITTSYLDGARMPFEDRIASLPGGRQLLEDEPLPVQDTMGLVEEVEAAEAATTEPTQEPATGAYQSNVTPDPDDDDDDEESGGSAASASASVPAQEPVTREAPIEAPEPPAPVTPDEQQRRLAAAANFARVYSNDYLLAGITTIDQPTARMLARLIVFNAINNTNDPGSQIEKIQAWLRQHYMSDGLDQIHFDSLPVVWIDKMLEDIGEEMMHLMSQNVILTAVALTTECALATGDSNSTYQKELGHYISAALKFAKEDGQKPLKVRS